MNNKYKSETCFIRIFFYSTATSLKRVKSMKLTKISSLKKHTSGILLLAKQPLISFAFTTTASEKTTCTLDEYLSSFFPRKTPRKCKRDFIA